MLKGRNNQFDTPAYVRVVRFIPLLVMVLGLGYATVMQVEDSQLVAQVEDSQPVANAGNAVSAGIDLGLIGVSSAHADQNRIEPQGVPYFPDAYVNQARDRYEHIQAF
ncbi:MAG TPA: hypothetical protein VGQ54_16390 [Burkholderiales bacterium]|jgi:hypothetical protein|nr:hypothetical protein [Burkholderiales bacterium]